MSTEMVLEFGELKLESLGSLLGCKLRLTETGLSWKQSKSGKLDSVASEDIAALEWVRIANAPALKVTQKNLTSHRFGGFKEEDLEKLRSFAQTHWDQEIPTQEVCVKGWNYGKAKFTASSLNFFIDAKSAFEVPLRYVSECNAAKSEVGLAFHQNEDCQVALTDLRFHVPVDPEDESGADPVEDFRKAVLRFAGIQEDDGRKPLVSFPQLFCNTPRGKYDFDIFSTHLSLHGKSYDFKISKDSILRMFLLGNKDGNHMFFVIAMDPPMRQGQTRYPYLVLEFDKEEEVDVVLNLTDKQLEETYKGKLSKEMNGPTYEVFCRVLRTIFNQKITVPGSFVGHSGTAAISCAYKQAAGFLYPLEKGFIFVHKPPMYIRFDDVASVHFARSDQSTKSFDFELETRSGNQHPFSGVEKEEYTKLFDFCQKKGLKIRGAGKMSGGKAKKSSGGGGGFSDSEDETELDPYKERLKKEAAARAEEEDSESSEEDSDYNPEQDLAQKRRRKEELKAKGQLSDSDDTGSDSEPDLEYDSEAGSTSSSGEGESSGESEDDVPKKKKKKAGGEGSRKPRAKKRGGRKDPNAPKKPSTPYFLWLNENRAAIKADLGDSVGVAEVAKEGGTRWKALSAEEKAVYEAKAEEDKARYRREMESYQPPESPEPSGKSAKAAKAAKKRSPTKATVSPKKNVKSKEFVSDSSDSDSEAKAGSKSGSKSSSSSDSSDEDGKGKKSSSPDEDSD